MCIKREVFTRKVTCLQAIRRVACVWGGSCRVLQCAALCVAVCALCSSVLQCYALHDVVASVLQCAVSRAAVCSSV